MGKEQAKKNAKFLAESVESELENFLQKNPIEKLETIQQKGVFIEPASMALNE